VKPRTLVIAALVLAGSAVSVRLGFWQLSRWHEKQALNAALREALAAPPLAPGELPADSLPGRRVRLSGRYDSERQVVLTARSHEGEPGVEVVTPFLLAGDSTAVLVDRGWLYAPDAVTAHPEAFREPGARTVTGFAERPRPGLGKPDVRPLPADSGTVYGTGWIALDSLAPLLPYRLAPYVVRELPDPAGPARPLRSAPRPYEESMHLSYAIQWFAIAGIILFGSAALARSRRGSRPPRAPAAT
jgi:surfeit locus 1 family protein